MSKFFTIGTTPLLTTNYSSHGNGKPFQLSASNMTSCIMMETNHDNYISDTIEFAIQLDDSYRTVDFQRNSLPIRIIDIDSK